MSKTKIERAIRDIEFDIAELEKLLKHAESIAPRIQEHAMAMDLINHGTARLLGEVSTPGRNTKNIERAAQIMMQFHRGLQNSLRFGVQK